MFELRVDGMSCGHCVQAVTDAVHSVAPQADVIVDLQRGRVTIEDGSTVASAALRTAIEAEGYTVH